MPLATIWRKPDLVKDEVAIEVRDVLVGAIASTLSVKECEVEVRVRDIGPLDLHVAPLGIEIDTGPGKKRIRIQRKDQIAKAIAARVLAHLPDLYEEVLMPGSYVWLRISESKFVPIASPEHAR